MKFERGDLVVWHRWDNVVEGLVWIPTRSVIEIGEEG